MGFDAPYWLRAVCVNFVSAVVVVVLRVCVATFAGHSPAQLTCRAAPKSKFLSFQSGVIATT